MEARSHSPTRHCNSPSSSSAFNFAVHRTPSPTQAGFNGGCSHSFTSSVASSSIKFSPDRSESQVRSAGRPVSPKIGAAMRPIPCTPPRKTCVCSPTNHPAECEEVCHGEFDGKNRRCGRRMGQKSPYCYHTPLEPPHAKENVFPAAA